MDLLTIIAGWFIFSVVAAVIANARGRSSTGYFLISIVLSPLVGIILAAAMPNLNVPKDPNAPTPETHVRCPDCRELVRMDATKCKHCGAALIPQAVGPSDAERHKASQDLIAFGKVIVGMVVVVTVIAIVLSMTGAVR